MFTIVETIRDPAGLFRVSAYTTANTLLPVASHGPYFVTIEQELQHGREYFDDYHQLITACRNYLGEGSPAFQELMEFADGEEDFWRKIEVIEAWDGDASPRLIYADWLEERYREDEAACWRLSIMLRGMGVTKVLYTGREWGGVKHSVVTPRTRVDLKTMRRAYHFGRSWMPGEHSIGDGIGVGVDTKLSVFRTQEPLHQLVTEFRERHQAWEAWTRNRKTLEHVA